MAREVSCERCQETFLLELDDSSGNCPKCGVNLPSHESSDPITKIIVGERTKSAPPETEPAPPEFQWSPAADSSDKSSEPRRTSARITSRVSGSGQSASASRQSGLAMLLVVVGSYASLLTIYVIYHAFFHRTHQLESLPDLETVQQLGGRLVIPLPESNLPPGHMLKLGESRRYGDIRVTPLRVARGPMNFSHYTRNAALIRSPSKPVLKLWLKFENVSDQASITPIDPRLMYFQRESEKLIAFNVIFPAVEQKSKNGRRFYHFDQLPIESEWQIVGQETKRELLPSESFETFIPSQEGIEGLSGAVVWRVHFRKGYGPKTGNGVTTLIDVRFNTDEILEDDA